MCPAAVGSSVARASRWCPTGEQVTLLEELYKGGLTNPNAGQIHQIVALLSRLGKVQGKNVFYWFQNHKARDKQRIRKKLVGREKQMVELRRCCGVIPAMRHGGCGGGLTWPIPQPRCADDGRVPSLVTLDLFPVTPGQLIKQEEASNQLSCNFSLAGAAPRLLPNPNLSLGLPAWN